MKDIVGATGDSDPAVNLDKFKADTESLRLKMNKELTSGSPLDSLKIVNATANEIDAAHEEGIIPDLLAVTKKMRAASVNGSIDSVLETQQDGEVQKTIEAGMSDLNNRIAKLQSGEVSPTVSDIHDISAFEKALGEQQEVSKDVTGAFSNASSGLTLEQHNRQTFMLDQYKLQYIAMKLFVGGASKDTVDKIMSDTVGLGIDVYDPIDFVVDAATGGLTAIGRGLVKEIIKSGSKTAMKDLAKVVGTNTMYGSLAGGFMTLADLSESGGVVTALSGIFGPIATTAIITASRKSLGLFLKSLLTSNTEMLRKFRATVKGGTDRFSKVSELILDDIDNGRISLTGERYVPVESPIASINVDGDAGAIKRIQDVAIVGSAQTDNVATTTAKDAMQTGTATHLTVFPTDTHTIKVKGEDLTIEQAGQLGDIINNPAEGYTDLQRYLYNSNKIASKVADHIYFDQKLGESTKDIISNRIYSDGTIHTGELAASARVDFAKGKIGGIVSRLVMTPDRYMKKMALAGVKLQTNAQKFVQEMVGLSTEVINKKVYGGLNKAEQAELENLFDLGTTNNIDFRLVSNGLQNPKTGEVITTSEKVIDRYYNGRLLMEQFYDQSVQAVNRDLTRKGYKMINGNLIGKEIKPTKGMQDIYGNTWNAEMSELGVRGYKLRDAIDPSNEFKAYMFIGPEEHLKRVGEINPHTQTLPKLEGYTPFTLQKKDSRYLLTQISKDESGKHVFRVVGASKTKNEAGLLADDLNGLGGGDNFYVVHKNRTDADGTDIGLSKALLTSLRHIKTDDLATLKKAMLNSGRFTKEEVEGIAGISKTYNYNDHWKSRGSQRVKSVSSIRDRLLESDFEAKGFDETDVIRSADAAPLLPAREAMASYVTKMSELVNKMEADSVLKDDYVTKYADVLDGTDWNSNIIYRANPAKALEAKELQDQMKRSFGLPTREGLLGREGMRAAADKMDNNPNTEFVGRLIDKHLSSGIGVAPASFLKKVGTNTALGLFNLSQMAVQPLVALNTVGKYMLTTPKILINAMGDFNGAYINAMVVGALKGPVTKENKYMLDLIRRSGFNSEMSLDTASELMHSYGKWRGGLKGAAGKFLKAGMGPMRYSEGAARGIAWFAERRRLISEIEGRGHPRLSKKDIDTDKFLTEVNVAAEAVVGDFSKMNKAVISRDGLKSAIFQFMQYPIFQSQFMFGKGLSNTERAGAFLAFAGALGIEGVPFIWNVVDKGEQVAAAAGHPEAVGSTKLAVQKGISQFMDKILQTDDIKQYPELRAFARRLMTKGLISAASQDDIDLATRASLADTLPRFLDSMSIYDLAGPGLQATINIMSGTIKTPQDLLDLYRSGELDVPRVAIALSRNFNKVSSIRNAANMFTPDLRNSRGEITIKDPTKFQRFIATVGVQPGQAVEIADRKRFAWTNDKAVRDYLVKESAIIAKLFVDSPNSGKRRLTESFHDIMKIHPAYGMRFLKLVMWRRLQNQMPPKLGAQLFEMKLHSEYGKFFD